MKYMAMDGYKMEARDYHELARKLWQSMFNPDRNIWDYENYYGKGVFCKEDFSILAELLKGIRGKFILSLNDRPEVRELFGGYPLETAEVAYTCSNGSNLKSAEVIIRNFD